jgi:hypothetical protein
MTPILRTRFARSKQEADADKTRTDASRAPFGIHFHSLISRFLPHAFATAHRPI